MFDGLDAIDWAALRHAHGEATDVPVLLRALLSSSAAERLEAIAGLHENIWHQDTVYPATAAAVQFLYELLADTDTPDKGSIAHLIACIADGRSGSEVLEGDDSVQRMRTSGGSGASADQTLFRKATEIGSVRRAVSSGLRRLLPYLSDPASDLRWSVAVAFGNYPEHASWLLPALDGALLSESDEQVRQALRETQARLIGQCAS